MEGRLRDSREYSRRLPPPEAWKNPAKWIDLSTGLARSDASKLVVPTDDRDFVKVDEAVERVIEYFFWSDYDWPYSNSDPETALDRHHFQHRAAAYAPEQFEGNLIPKKFRENPTKIGLMPRQLHNVFHDFTTEPPVPEYEAMEGFVVNYQLAQQAFSRLMISAKNVTHASRLFASRAEALRNGVEPRQKDDQVAQEMMRDFFNRHFTQYGQAVEEILRFQGGDFIAPIENQTIFERPHLVVKKMGRYVTQGYVNFVPQLQAA